MVLQISATPGRCATTARDCLLLFWPPSSSALGSTADPHKAGVALNKGLSQGYVKANGVCSSPLWQFRVVRHTERVVLAIFICHNIHHRQWQILSLSC